jgi:hypothetical protein
MEEFVQIHKENGPTLEEYPAGGTSENLHPKDTGGPVGKEAEVP